MPAAIDGSDWRTAANCLSVGDPEIFFPEPGERPIDAKRVCAACPVSAECLAWALDNNELYGVWGGTTRDERRVMRRRRRLSTVDSPFWTEAA